MVNVYSSCDLLAERRLWGNLIMSKQGFGGNAWCVLGDFNAVLHYDERRGLNQLSFFAVSSEIVEFRDFVRDMDLIDLPVLGRKFTWVHPNGVTMSRIDRVLASEAWLGFGVNPSL
jgi:hypothetical protein